MKKFIFFIKVVLGIAITIGVIFLFVYFLSFLEENMTRQYKVESREIKSCILNSEVEEKANGCFVLGVGDFNYETNSNPYYYIYIKGVKGFRLQKIKAEHLEIVLTDEKTPCIEGVFTDRGYIYDNVREAKNDNFSSKNAELAIEYVIYVPENTIKEYYSIDLEKDIQ